MLKEIAERFDDRVLADVAARYGVCPADLRELDGFENYVYQFRSGGQDRILRIGHSLRRTASCTLGEVEWLSFLADGGLPVARAVPSTAGSCVETFPDTHRRGADSYFVAVAFERVPGVLLDDEPEAKARYWNGALFEHWGRVMGRLHARSQSYVPSDAAIKRPEWHEYDVLDLDRFIPPDQTLVHARGSELLSRLKSLPCSPETYGLIHADLTQWNFRVESGQITVYDFDSSEYCWFVKDIAVALYYAPASHEGEDRDAFVEKFLRRFLKGYQAEFQLDRQWLGLIPDFLMLQKLILYAFCHQIWDLESLDEEQKRYLGESRKVLEDDLPVLSVDEALLDRVWH